MNPIYDQPLEFTDLRLTFCQRLVILFSRKLSGRVGNGWRQIYEIAIEPLEKQLAECYRLTGANTDGNEDWRLAERAVGMVQSLRSEYDRMSDNYLILEEREKARITNRKPRKKK